MEDRKILELYLTRSEQAIRETEAKYGGYCYSVAMNILENRQDAQECVSDTWFSAWNSIPPQSPGSLRHFWEALPGTWPLTAGGSGGQGSGAAAKCSLRWTSSPAVSPAGRVPRGRFCAGSC